MITIAIPGAPYGKGRPRVGKIGQHARLFTPEKTVAYEGLVAHCGALAMRGLPLLEGALEVVMDIRMVVPQSWSEKRKRQALADEIVPTTKPDVDNVVKAVFDGLNGVVWPDDVQVARLTVEKRYSTSPGVYLTVERIVPVTAAEQTRLVA